MSSLGGQGYWDLELLPSIYEAKNWKLLILDNEEIRWAFPGESEDALVSKLYSLLGEGFRC